MAKPVYTLRVWVTEGPMTEAFFEANPEVMRTIEIRGEQTLEQLHRAIFAAFDRDDEHMYEFQFGEGPHDRTGPRYAIKSIGGFCVDDGEPSAGDVAKTRMDALGLKVEQAFGYWFDFGDDWYHELQVAAIGEAQPGVRYPRVTESIGDSPPQYIDWDEEDDEDDWEGDEEEENADVEEPGPEPSAAGAPPRLPLAP